MAIPVSEITFRMRLVIRECKMFRSEIKNAFYGRVERDGAKTPGLTHQKFFYLLVLAFVNMNV